MRKLLVVLAFVTIVAAANAQEATDIVHWSAKLASTRPVKPGEKTAANLEATIEEGWHIYSLTQVPGGPAPTVIEVRANQVLRSDGAVMGNAPMKAFDANFLIETEFYEESAAFKVPLVVVAGAKPGPAKAVINVTFQTCTERFCLPPTTVDVPVVTTIAAAGSSAKPARTDRHAPGVAK